LKGKSLQQIFTHKLDDTGNAAPCRVPISPKQLMDARDSAVEPPVDETERTSTASVLVVDDDPGGRFLMRTALEHVGFEVIEAADGIEGYELHERHRPDLLLVDLMMPRMNGYELCRKLRSHAHSAYVPIVVVTGADDMPSVARAYDAGATDFVAKPVNWLALAHHVRYILRHQERLITAKEDAEAVNQSKSEFLSNMSHEVRLLIASLTSTSPIDQASPLVFSLRPEGDAIVFPPVLRIVHDEGKNPPAVILDPLSRLENARGSDEEAAPADRADRKGLASWQRLRLERGLRARRTPPLRD
jgi:CheY-like chemotaxis protein